MGKNIKHSISRKDFLKKSSVGLLSIGLLGDNTFDSASKRNSLSTKKLRVLGRTGIKVSPIGFGASRTMEPSLVRMALDYGINFFDTGRSYFNGHNLEMLGTTLKEIRKEVIIQSKYRIRVREDGEELHSAETIKKMKEGMKRELDISLKSLQTDYIDVLLIHDTSSVEIIQHEVVQEFYAKAKDRGQIRACGLSTHSNQIEILRAVNSDQFYDVVMVTYNHKGAYTHSNSGSYSEWDQPALEIEMKKAATSGIGLVAMKTCSGGPTSLDKHSKPSFKDALKWVINHDYIHTSAVAMANIDEMKENV